MSSMRNSSQGNSRNLCLKSTGQDRFSACVAGKTRPLKKENSFVDSITGLKYQNTLIDLKQITSTLFCMK